MTTQKRIELILTGASADLAAVPHEAEPVLYFQRPDWLDRQADAERGIVELRTAAWLGLDRLSHSDSTLVSRALHAGESRGLWRRLQSPGGRTTHLQLIGVTDEH